MTSLPTVSSVATRLTVVSSLLVAALTSAPTQGRTAPNTPPPTPPARPGAPSSPDSASPAPKPQPWAVGVSADHRGRALRHFRTGNTLFARANYTAALVEYRKAVQLWDHPSIRYNMAVSYIHRTQNLKAYRSLRAALRFGRGPLSRERFRRAKTYQKLLQGRLAFIRVTCEEPGAEVTLDGHMLFNGRGQAKRTVEPGYHVVIASKPGYITTKRRLQLKPGLATEVKLGLVPIRSAYVVQRRWRRFLPWTVLGSALAVGAVGLALTLQARTDMSRYNSRFAAECPDGCVNYTPALDEGVSAIPDHLVSLEKRSRAMNAAGITLLASAGAAAAVGITLLILNLPVRLERKPPVDVQQRRLTVFPHIGPTGAGLSAQLRF